MSESSTCLHLEVRRLEENSLADRLHRGSEKAYYCQECGGVFFLSLTPAEIRVTYGRPEEEHKIKAT